MNKIVIILALISIIFQMKAQVPNNVAQPYSVLKNIEIELNKIAKYTIEKPIYEDEKLNDDDNYAFNIDSHINIIEKGTKINLPNKKSLTLMVLKVEGAKSLNFTFEDFYLSQNTKMYIYNVDRTQVMGPVTNISNNSSFNTHLIFSNEIIIEIVSDSPLENTVVLKNIAYGIKDAVYFDNIIKDSDEEFNFLSIQSPSCHPDIDTLERNCQFVGEKSPLDTFKQINCSQFDILEKAKRSLCIVITKDSLHTGWRAKGGILLNTADASATNYCNSYVLTCNHCITDYPKYFAIRFNWLRKECEIPPGIANCTTDNQPWIDLINMDEVIDYCDVELVSREKDEECFEYAFLKINEPLRFKEYFSSWKIFERQNLTLDSSYVAGPWGQNPLQAMIIDINIDVDKNIDIPLSLVGGHSGNSVFDKKAHFVGMVTCTLQAISTGFLYFDPPWSSPTPRDILDPNGIYTTDFANGDSIVVEGVERYEKSNCLKSNVNCNPLLNLSDYITPIFGEGGCCFRLEYIPAMTGFLGGSPYGIRIYRDNETQNTLYYDFGSNIFAGDSATYYNPMNDNVITFCVDPLELAADGGKIVIEFQDANGRIICVKEVEVECLDCCSDENLQIYLESAGDPGDCCAYLLFDIDTVNTLECGFDFVNVYDNLDSSIILGSDIIRWQNTLFTVPFAFCNYDTFPKQLLVEFYDEDSTLICSKVTPQFLPPCEVILMVNSGSKDKELFDLATKSIKQKEITFEYYTKESENIEIELFNKYNVSQGVILSKDSKKGTSEFSLNIENLKPGIYIFKMKGKKDSIIRRLIIE